MFFFLNHSLITLCSIDIVMINVTLLRFERPLAVGEHKLKKIAVIQIVCSPVSHDKRYICTNPEFFLVGVLCCCFQRYFLPGGVLRHILCNFTM